MAAPITAYSDEERDRLRAALRAYADHYELSPQQLSDRIAEATRYAMAFEGGRKRVDRFLKNSHRQTDDFIAAVAAFLGSVPPPDVQEMAATLAHFFARPLPRPIVLEELEGRYLAWGSFSAREEARDSIGEVTVFDGFSFAPSPIEKLDAKFAYAVIEMKPFEKSDALIVSEAIINPSLDPAIASFPETLPAPSEAGIITAFGFSDREVPRYFMTTRTMLETRVYRLFRKEADPLILRGEMTFHGGVGRTPNNSHADPLHADCTMELVRITELEAQQVEAS